MIYNFTCIGMDSMGLWVERSYWSASKVLSLLLSHDYRQLSSRQLKLQQNSWLCGKSNFLNNNTNNDEGWVWWRISLTQDLLTIRHSCPLSPRRIQINIWIYLEPKGLTFLSSEKLMETLPLSLPEGDQKMGERLQTSCNRAWYYQ